MSTRLVLLAISAYAGNAHFRLSFALRKFVNIYLTGLSFYLLHQVLAICAFRFLVTCSVTDDNIVLYEYTALRSLRANWRASMCWRCSLRMVSSWCWNWSRDRTRGTTARKARGRRGPPLKTCDGFRGAGLFETAVRFGSTVGGGCSLGVWTARECGREWAGELTVGLP